MKSRRLNIFAAGVALAVLVGAVAASDSLASVNGKKNTAIGLTAASAYLFAKDKDTLGLATGVGAAAAWHQYNKERDQVNRQRAYQAGYSAARSSGSSYRSTARSTAPARSSAPARTVAVAPKPAPAASPPAAPAAYQPVTLQPAFAPAAPVSAGVLASGSQPFAAPADMKFEDQRGTLKPWLWVLGAFVLGIAVALGATRVQWPRVMIVPRGSNGSTNPYI